MAVGASTDGATEGTDYTAVDDFPMSIAAGNTADTATFTLTPTDDVLAEGVETLSVAGATTAAGFTVTGTEVALIDDDTPSAAITLSVSPSSVPENAGATTVTVTATLDASPFTEQTEVTVSVGDASEAGDAATKGMDYTAVTDFTVTIPGGETVGTGTFTLIPNDDTMAEGDETLLVSGTAAGITVTGTTVMITDDESASTGVALSVLPASVAEDAGATTVTVTATLDAGAFTEPMGVTVSVGDAGDAATEGTDYAMVPDGHADDPRRLGERQYRVHAVAH